MTSAIRRRKPVPTSLGFSSGLGKNHHVLPRQEVQRVGPFQTKNTHLTHNLLLGHLVQGPDGHTGVFATVFEQENATTGPQSLKNAVNHLKWMGEFMVGIHHNRGIDGVWGQIGIINLAQHAFNIGYTNLGHLSFDQLQHLWLYIHRQHLARLPGVAKMQSSFALRTVFSTTALPLRA